MKLTLKRLFGGLSATWGFVLLFAAATGIYTGLIMVPSFLYDTSFQDIGISYEWWVVFALIVVTNCSQPLEAALKCFVYFLISQPLVYLVEILCGSLSLEMGWYYYRTIWFRMTLLTLPGGFIAFFSKKQNLLGGIVLGLGNTILAFLAVHYIYTVWESFPHHLLTAIFCVAAEPVLSFAIQSKKLPRLISLVLPVVLTVALVAYLLANGLSL